MKKLFFAVLVLSSSVLMTGCGGWASKEASDVDSLTQVTTYDFTEFDRINAGKIRDWEDYDGGMSTEILKVNIVRDDVFGVELRVANVEDSSLFEVTQEGRELTVWINRLWPGRRTRTVTVGKTQITSSSGRVSRRARAVRAVVTVHMPQLSAVTVEGFSSVSVDGSFETEDDFSVDVSGVAFFEGLDVKAEKVDVEVSGAANFKKCGFTARDRADFDLTGLARLVGCAVTADFLKLDVTGATQITGTTAQFEDGRMVMDGACKISIESAGDDPKGTEATCGSLDIDVDGLAKVDLSYLRCRNVRAEAEGLSRVKVYATESLWYRTSDMARVRSYGHPADITSIKED